LGDEEAALERMVLGSKAQSEWIAIAPRDRLDMLLCVAMRGRAQDGARAHAAIGGVLESRHDRERPRGAVFGIAAGEVAVARVERVVAQLDVLAGNVVLVAASSVVMPRHARVRGRALRPVDI